MTFPTLFSTLVLLFALSPLQAAAKANVSEPCDPANTKLQIGTYELSGECFPALYCDPTSKTCAKRGCRREEFPPHFGQGGEFPPLCPEGQFCPDEGDACQPLIAEGQPCQLNRDDMCAPPSDGTGPLLHDPPFNTNGSVCINFTCRTATVTEGQPCEVEQIPYIAYSDTDEFAFVVSRGNCVKGLYCDAGAKICNAKKALGGDCSADKECTSDNCAVGGKCGEPLNATAEFPMYVYIVVGVGIVGGIVITMVVLYFIHRRGRDDEHEKRTQYWREQTAMRQNIMQMKESARSGYHRGGHPDDNPDHLASGESQMPMLPGRDDYSRGPINSLSRPKR